MQMLTPLDLPKPPETSVSTLEAALEIEPEDGRDALLHEVGEHARSGTDGVHAVGHAERDVEDAHFEHVAGLRAVDIDGAGQHVGSARRRFLHLVIDRAVLRQHLVSADAVGGEERRRIGVVERLLRHGVDAHGLARPDVQAGLGWLRAGRVRRAMLASKEPWPQRAARVEGPDEAECAWW